LAALSTTNEIAPGAFVSDGKHAAFRGPPLILRRRLATGAASACVTRKDSLARRKHALRCRDSAAFSTIRRTTAADYAFG
jgi:hypothetical protein